MSTENGATGAEQSGVSRREPIRVLNCRSSGSIAGPEHALLHLASALGGRGVETQELALYRRGAEAPELHPWIEAARAAGLAADQVLDPGPFSIGVVRRMDRRIRRSGAQILHTHDYKTNILGGIAARRPDRGMPWVATVHLHTDTSRRLRLYRKLDLFLLRLADRVVTVSRDQCEMLARRGVDRNRIALIPTVIDGAAFRARAGEPAHTRQALGLSPAAPVVTLIGRLSNQKGVDDFLIAAERIHRAQPEARFLVVGQGPQRAALEAQAEALALDGAVSFLGYRSDTAPLLAASDVVALPSRAEGLPVVLLEAMAIGRPVVAARVGGVPDVLSDDETGLLVPPNAPDTLAERILGLLAEPGHARAIGAAAQRLADRRYAPATAARRLSAVYRTVLAERG